MIDNFFDGFPDELVLGACSYMQPQDLLAASSTCQRLAALPVDRIWRDAYAHLTIAWPMYALTPERELALNSAESTAQLSWKRRYFWVPREAQRVVLTEAEMSSLRWLFNFTAHAGGQGLATLKEARFVNSHLLLPGFPPLPYALTRLPSMEHATDNDHDTSASTTPIESSVERNPSNLSARASSASQASGLSFLQPQQAVRIANFPPHIVERVPSTREWLISNDNVTVVSCHAADGGYGTFTDRNFLDAPPEQRTNMFDA